MANFNKMNKRALLSLILLFSNITFLYAQTDMDHEHPRGLNIPQDVKDYWKDRKTVQKSIQVQYPGSKDWKYKDSSVKNQYWCGSCWAFAAVALVENIGSQNDLSEQVLISCASGDCGGGWYGDALYYIQNNGLPPENCYPYQIANGNCDDKCDTPEFLEKLTYADRWGRWGTPDENTVNDLKGLLQYGPVVVAMLVPEDGTFDSYSGGVYNYDGGYISGSNGHAVLVVGYNDSGEYFQVKNSWGSNWGESGYFKISYDDVTDDVQFGGYACIASVPYTEYPETETVSQPGSPAGETFPIRNVSYVYSTSGATSNLGHTVEYQFDWGDGSYSSWSTTTTASHAWSSDGEKSITVTARCQTHTEIQNASEALIVNVQTPVEIISKPGTPSGNSRPTRGVDYAYVTSGASSNLGHGIEYQFDWGDGSCSEWSVSKTASHSWSSFGEKPIQVIARCQTHHDKIAESDFLHIIVEPVEVISKPDIAEGNLYPTRGNSFSYGSGGSQSNLGHDLEYRFLWGDSTNSDWQTDSSAAHIWNHNGFKPVVVQVRCVAHPDKDNQSDTLWVTVQDPEVISKPGIPSGPAEIVMETEGEYTCGASISNLVHAVEYQFNWGDGETSEWAVSPQATHQWADPGFYSVSMMARCEMHPEKYSVSDTLTVHVRYPQVTMTFESVPENLYLVISDSSVQTPYTYTGFPEDSLNVYAPGRQGYWLFDHWIQGSDSIQNLIIPYSDSTYTAFYSLEQFSIQASVNDSIMGSVALPPADTLYDAETEVLLTAIANDGFCFSHWSGDLGSNQAIDTLIVDGPKMVVAHFKQIDNRPPFLYSFYPLPDCQEIPQNEVVQFKLSDSLSFVDLEQIQITLNQTVLFSEGINQQPGQLSVHALAQGYWFIYQPASALSQDSLVSFNISCQDTAYFPNRMDTTITFQQGQSQLSIFYTDTLSPSQNTFNLVDSLSLTLKIDSTLIPDDLFIRLGLVNHYPPLPDTLDIVGQPVHLGPQGIQFESADSVQLVFQTRQQEGVDSTSCIDYTIWFYSTQDSGWVNIPYALNGAALQIHCSSSGYYAVALVVDEFVPQPNCPAGDTLIVTDSTYIYQTFLMTSNRGKLLEYSFDWGNGDFSQWSTDTMASYIWLEPGVYPVLVKARNMSDTTQIEVSDTLIVHVIDSRTGIEDWLAVPDKFMMDPNYPNPFNPETTIRYGLPEADDVRLEIYNIVGQRVAVLLDENKKAGYHQITWRGMNDSGHSVSSGIYFVVLRSSKKVLKQKVMLLR